MLLIILTYLAGVLTILSPCILPVLPFIFSGSQQSFLKSGLPLLGGMSLTFSLFSVLAIVGGEWMAQANEVGRVLAMVLLSIFGLSLIFPQVAEKLMAPFSRLGSRLESRAEPSLGPLSSRESIGRSFLVGVSTGLLWAPCAGPILGLVLTGAASQKNVSTSVGLLLSYSLGAATSLAIALVAGNKFLGTLKKFLGLDQMIKKGLGIAVLLGVIVIAFNLDRTLLTQISKIETTSLENKLLSFWDHKTMEETLGAAQIHSEGVMPELSGAVGWLNSDPLLKKDLLGKVVLVDFWTYSCINCLRTLPYIKAWAEKYKTAGLIVLGVHTPEFAFEKNIGNVQKAIRDLGVTYPVVIDNDYKIWNSFQNHYWPAHYFIDRQGRIRSHHFGEGEYEQSEKLIRELLSENGGAIQASEMRAPGAEKIISAQGVQAPSDLNDIESPETYIGYGRAENFASRPSVQPDRIAEYQSLKELRLNQWSLVGSWLITEEKAVLTKPHGKIRFRFHSRDLHLVLGIAEGGSKKIKFKVTLDGHPLGEDRGEDTDRNGIGEIDSHRLYQLIRQKKGAISDHMFEIEFFDADVEAFAFTFG